MHDECGTYTWPDGRIYVGGFVKDKKEGEGIFTWPDGRKYEGQWLEGKQHGRGKYTDPEKKERIGIWVNGKRTRWIKNDSRLENETGIWSLETALKED